MRIVAVTCVRNEGPFLLEWIAFHRLLGVGDFLFYSNDCTDGTDLLLDGLARCGIVTHLPNPARGRKYQMEALKAAARHPLVRCADWVWIGDVDEFPNIHAGNHTFGDLIAACGTPQAISLSFQYMANAGVTAFADTPLTGQFTRTHNPDIWGHDLAIEVKTLVRGDFPLTYFGAHRPFHDDTGAQPRWTDGSGRQVPPGFRRRDNKRRIRAFPARGARRFATLNHYALRSRDSYLVKVDRGDVNRAHRAFDVAYWSARNDAGHEDQSILRHAPALRAELAALGALPGIADLHAGCVAAHRARIAQLHSDPQMQALWHALDTAVAPGPREAALRALIHARAPA